MELNNTALMTLPDQIERPRYDRAALTPGIVHIGMGNFHRAHQAWYVHRLMQQGLALDWAIIGAGVRPADAAMRDRLLAQDCLTTLIELDPSGTRAEIVGSIIDFLPVQPDNAALIAQLSDPCIRIVSMTVTEGGYFLDPATKTFDPTQPDIRFDVAYPDRPCTAFGAIVAALRARRAAGVAPFTCQSCDNLLGNGAILRQVVVGLARLSDADLADWIDAQVAFPNSMVDCIVPATGPREIALAASMGLTDTAPVTHERFRQWVIEDRFSAGRPPWEQVGATFTDAVHEYEGMKLRILNAGHQMIAAPGEILGLRTIAECMAHPGIRGLMRKIALDEVAPILHAVPGMTPQAYVDLVDRRFANPQIIDTVRRVAFDGSSRHTGSVLPTIRARRAAGLPTSGLALSQALWARMCTGLREDGTQIEPNDPDWPALTVAAKAARATPQAWLEQRHYYGALADDASFAAEFSGWLTRLHRDGVEATLAQYLTP